MRVQAARLARVDNVLAGRTAAWLHGLWNPPPGQIVPIELARPRRASGDRLAGTRRSRRVWRGGDVQDLGDLLVTSPMRTAFDLIRERQLVEAVVVADAFAHGKAFCLDDFAAYVTEHVRWPGVGTARRATRLASALAASSGESRMRMVVVLSGFPAPVVQAEIVLPSGVRYLDLLLDRVRRPVGLEYDGAHHGEATRRRSDLRRENAILVGTQLPLLRYDSYSLAYEIELMVRELVLTTGFRDTKPLSFRDFWRGPRSARW